MHAKQKWTRPVLRRFELSDRFDPASGLSEKQWQTLMDLRRRAERAIDVTVD